jgi:hypothetical protein
MEPRALRILRIAEDNGGRYLLPRRYDRRPIGTVSNGGEKERDYEACQALVLNGLARWIVGNYAPGITITRL